MPEFPKKAVFDLGARKLFIDDVEFPWAIDAAGPILANRGMHMCTVTVPILVHAIEVVPAPPEKSKALREAELGAVAAEQALDAAMKSTNPHELRDAQLNLAEARAELARLQR